MSDFPPLISAHDLMARLTDINLVLFDATKFMPHENRDAFAAYRQKHIPGARFFDIDVIADPEAELPHTVPSPARFEKLMRQLGVRKESFVVFYDQSGLTTAARGWWLMGLFGHDHAAVLDGGLPAWMRAGGKVTAKEPPPAYPTNFRAGMRARRLVGSGDLLDNLVSHDFLVLDARSTERFVGDVPELRSGVRQGHVPGSTSMPYRQLLRTDGTFQDAAWLRQRFTEVGVGKAHRVITMCGGGSTACILTLGLRIAGFDDGAVYDGSWNEWGARADLPCERGLGTMRTAREETNAPEDRAG